MSYSQEQLIEALQKENETLKKKLEYATNSCVKYEKSIMNLKEVIAELKVRLKIAKRTAKNILGQI